MYKTMVDTTRWSSRYHQEFSWNRSKFQVGQPLMHRSALPQCTGEVDFVEIFGMIFSMNEPWTGYLVANYPRLVFVG